MYLKRKIIISVNILTKSQIKRLLDRKLRQQRITTKKNGIKYNHKNKVTTRQYDNIDFE